MDRLGIKHRLMESACCSVVFWHEVVMQDGLLVLGTGLVRRLAHDFRLFFPLRRLISLMNGSLRVEKWPLSGGLGGSVFFVVVIECV